MTLSPSSRFLCGFAALTLASSLSAGTIIYGDDFTRVTSTIVNTLSVWEVSNHPSGSAAGVTDPASEFGSLSLYGGVDNALVDPLTGSPLSFISSSYTSSLVSGYQYQQGSVFFDVYKISFAGLSLNVAANDLYDFGIGATPGTSTKFFLHASNADLSGSTQDGADGLFLEYSSTGDLLAPYRLTAAIDSNPLHLNGSPLWNKSSDINVEIGDGTGVIFQRALPTINLNDAAGVSRSNISWSPEVPEPATFGMFAIGAGALFFLRRRRA